MRNSTPLSTIEEAAFQASGYTSTDSIETLYQICSNVDPNEIYAQPGFAASESQIAEISAALILCPQHPQAPAWRQSVERGKEEARLQASGQLFSAGTFLVNTEIKPGTYAVEGEIEGCYWERQDKNGRTIANDFITSARRVQVTIRPTDYAFHSDHCGQWRPA